MLNALNFVKGAVARKDFAPVLTHFHITEGRITGYNGSMALSSPIPLDLEVCPKAIEFVKALNTCRTVISISAMPNGSIVVKSGTYTARVNCSPDPFPKLDMTGREVKLANPILPALKILAPFISDDASRQWSRGILFKGQSAYATTNIVICETWLGWELPVPLNIPKTAVTELIRIGTEPDKIVVKEIPNDDGELRPVSCVFYFPNGRWLYTHVYPIDWPDIAKVLNRPNTPVKIPDGFFQGVTDISPLSDEARRIFLYPGKVSTVTRNHQDAGTHSDVPGLEAEDGCYDADALNSLDGVATSIDFSMYPSPCIFYGDKLRGAIIGKRYEG